jgi:hypothetical protein
MLDSRLIESTEQPCTCNRLLIFIIFNINRWLCKMVQEKPKPSRKIESVNKAVLFWYWLRPKTYFFRKKTFLFFKIESWIFQHLFEREFHETSQKFCAFRQLLFSFFLSVVWLSWNCVRFHEILFQTDSESFSFLS